MNDETARQGRSATTATSTRIVTLRLAEALVEILEEDRPTCPVCRQRAWPGDDTRHIVSAHRRHELEIERDAVKAA